MTPAKQVEVKHYKDGQLSSQQKFVVNYPIIHTSPITVVLTPCSPLPSLPLPVLVTAVVEAVVLLSPEQTKVHTEGDFLLFNPTENRNYLTVNFNCFTGCRHSCTVSCSDPHTKSAHTLGQTDGEICNFSWLMRVFGFIQNIPSRGHQSDEKELWHSIGAYNIHLQQQRDQIENSSCNSDVSIKLKDACKLTSI